MDTATAERLAIRELIENWVLWRDAGDWDRFATVWHDDGWMTATWFQGPARDFIAVSREGLRQGRQHPALPGRVHLRRERQSRHLPGEDDDQPARRGPRGAGGRGVHRAVLRLSGKARRPMGHRAPPADLREGPDGSGRHRAAPVAGRAPAGVVPRGLPAPGVSAVVDRLQGEGQPAGSPGRLPWRSCTARAPRGWRARPRPVRRSRLDSKTRFTPARRLAPRCPQAGPKNCLHVWDRSASRPSASAA